MNFQTWNNDITGTLCRERRRWLSWNKIALQKIYGRSDQYLYELEIVDTTAAPAITEKFLWTYLLILKVSFFLIYLETLLCGIYFSVV